MRLVVYNIGVIKHFSPWDIVWSEGIEIYLDKKFKEFLVKIYKSI